jgi:hypothetical protein
MTDIVERLRVNMHAYGVCQEAADEIVRLRAERDEWRQCQKEAVESRERWHEVCLEEKARAEAAEAERDRLRDALQDLSMLRGVLYRDGMTDAERADKWRDHVNQMRLAALAALKGDTP